MGQSKTSGYIRENNLTDQQGTLLNQLLGQSGQNYQQAAQGYSQFLPGGNGGQALTDMANKNFQQVTLPSIFNQFGSNAKSSSALNQALAAGASDLNSNIAAQLSQLQLQGAQGLGNLAANQAQTGIGREAFSFAKPQQPLWQSILRGAVPIIGAGIGGAFGGIPGVLAGASAGQAAGNAFSQRLN